MLHRIYSELDIDPFLFSLSLLGPAHITVSDVKAWAASDVVMERLTLCDTLLALRLGFSLRLLVIDGVVEKEAVGGEQRPNSLIQDRRCLPVKRLHLPLILTMQVVTIDERIGTWHARQILAEP